MAGDGFQEFVHIVDEGSISAAARVLGLPRATLSRRLGRLEDRLGVRLLHRNTRRLAPTQAGEELYRRARRLLTEATEAEEAVRRLDGVPRGLLRVTSPPLGGNEQLAVAFRSFLHRYPDVTLELFTTMRHVDLVKEGLDVALRGGTVRDPALVARRLRTTRVMAIASPAYVEARGMPQSVAELVHHNCVCGYDPVTLRPVRAWPLLGGGSVPVRGRIATNDLELAVSIALSGDAIALCPSEVPRILGAEPGALLEVLPDEIGRQGGLSVVYPEREHLDPKVRAFVDHMVEVTDQMLYF